jgi:hypothetical protein
MSDEFAKAVNGELQTLHKSVVAKLQTLIEAASQNLKDLVAEGEKQIDSRLPLALADLDQIIVQTDAEAVSTELQTAVESFLSSSKVRLQAVELGQDSVLKPVIDEELLRLGNWRAGELKHFTESFEQVIGQVEQQRISSLSALESCFHSLSEELRRLQGFDLERLALLNSELSENLEQACRLAEMRITRHCDMALAEQILPLLAEWKSKLGLRARGPIRAGRALRVISC